MTIAEPAGRWQDQAVCRTLTPTEKRRFHSPNPLDQEWACRTCHTCPVEDPCLQTALADPTLKGIWGATRYHQRWPNP